MGSFFVRGQTIHVKFKDEAGKWCRRSTGCKVGEERKAERVLKELEEGIAAARDSGYRVTGPVTVRSYARQWTEERKQMGLSDAGNDWKRLKHHVLPHIGDLLVTDVRHYEPEERPWVGSTSSPATTPAAPRPARPATYQCTPHWRPFWQSGSWRAGRPRMAGSPTLMTWWPRCPWAARCPSPGCARRTRATPGGSRIWRPWICAIGGCTISAAP